MCTRPGKYDHVLVLPHKGVSPIPLLAPSSFFPAFSSFAGLRPSTDSAVSAYTPLLLPSGLSNKYFPLTGRKSTLEDYLVSRHGFTSIHLEPANHYVRTRKFTLVLSLSLFLLVPWLVLPESFWPSGPLTVAERENANPTPSYLIQ